MAGKAHLKKSRAELRPPLHRPFGRGNPEGRSSRTRYPLLSSLQPNPSSPMRAVPGKPFSTVACSFFLDSEAPRADVLSSACPNAVSALFFLFVTLPWLIPFYPFLSPCILPIAADPLLGFLESRPEFSNVHSGQSQSFLSSGCNLGGEAPVVYWEASGQPDKAKSHRLMEAMVCPYCRMKRSFPQDVGKPRAATNYCKNGHLGSCFKRMDKELDYGCMNPERMPSLAYE